MYLFYQHLEQCLRCSRHVGTQSFLFFIFLSIYLLIMLLQLSHLFFLFGFLCPMPTFPPAFPLHLSSCPWVMRVSSLASSFPIPVLTSPCIFCSYQLCFLIPTPFPPFSFPADNLPNDPQTYDSVPVLVVYLIFVFIYFFVK